MKFDIDGMQENIRKLNSAIELNDKETLYEFLTIADRLYGTEIPSINDSIEEIEQYSGTLIRNAKVVSAILEDYVNTHSCVCFSQIESDDEELNNMVQSSIRLYNSNELSLATEKIWDAFERLKTYYSPRLDKKKSADEIIEKMSASEPNYKNLYFSEFGALTKIGNDFRIRHHETTKVDITDTRQYDYLYKRCISLISLAVTYLKEETE